MLRTARNPVRFAQFAAKDAYPFSRTGRYGGNQGKDMDCSIPLNGIFTAQRTLEQSARRIAASPTSTDLAADMVSIQQAKIAEEANFRVISVEQNLGTTLLDRFA
jgi:hypothetical protein